MIECDGRKYSIELFRELKKHASYWSGPFRGRHCNEVVCHEFSLCNVYVCMYVFSNKCDLLYPLMRIFCVFFLEHKNKAEKKNKVLTTFLLKSDTRR